VLVVVVEVVLVVVVFVVVVDVVVVVVLVELGSKGMSTHVQTTVSLEKLNVLFVSLISNVQSGCVTFVSLVLVHMGVVQ